jgi:hypothetical protein
MALTIDETDPCGSAATLRALYVALVSGGAAATVSFRAGASGVERSVVYHKADPARLLSVIRDFERRCAALQGGSPHRYAIRAGGR